MARCRGCGADVTFVQVDGEVVSLDNWGTVMGSRYVITDFFTEPWTANRLDPTDLAEGHPDHGASCPAQQ